MSRSRNGRVRYSRAHKRAGCDRCLNLRRRKLVRDQVAREMPAEAVTGVERWYDWEGGFLECDS